MDPQFEKSIQDFLDQSKKAQREDKETADLFEMLLRHEGWKRYMEVLNKLIQARGEEVLAPAKSIDGAVALEHVKGAMSGLIMARDLPSVIIASMKAAVPVTDGEDE